jgi:intein/homing endonuclease
MQLLPFKMQQVSTQTVNWGLMCEGIPSLWKITKGHGIRVAIIDTGIALRHHDLADAILKTIDFTKSRNGADDILGHGCIAPNDKIYTNLCGLQQISEFFDRVGGVTHFLNDGSITKDISRFNIKTISAGLDGHSVPSKITAVHKLNYDGPIYNITTREGDLTLTPWHPVYVVSSRRGKEMTIVDKRADELLIGDNILATGFCNNFCGYFRMPLHTRWICRFCGYVARAGKRKQCRKCNKHNWHNGPTTYDIPLNEDLAFWIGLIITDGHLFKLKAAGYIDFSSSVESSLGALYDRLTKQLFNIETHCRQRNNCYSYRFCNNDLHNMLTAIGIPNGNKSLIIRIPELILKSPRSVIMAFLAGIIEGDGCVSGNRVRIGTSSIGFANDLVDLARMLGIRASYGVSCSDKTNFKSVNPYYMVRLASSNELVSSLRIKKCKASKNESRCTTTISSISKAHYSGNLYDLTIKDHHKYAANGMIVSNTFCAGVIGARQNGPCIVGVAPECQLLVAKVVSDNGACYDQAVIDALYWAAEQGTDVISMSVGSPTPTEELHSAVINASQKAIIVCAAGNNGPALDSVNYPARYTETIGVGAVDRRKRVSNYSSRGDRVDIVAPGDEVVSCWPPNRTAMLSGTSAACPFVAGVIALIVADRKQDNRATLHRDEMLNLLNESAIDIEKPGRDKLSGFGLINPVALLRESDERYPK